MAGLSKFRYGDAAGNFRFAEAVLQGDYRISDELSAILVLRGEPEQRTGIDMLEGYVSWHPAAEGSLSWSVKTGAFFPAISLENDDLGWTSPYTLTPSAINSWIGEELRTIGSEAIVRYDTGKFGTVSLTASVFCCNDPAGVLIADRGWAMDDRPSGMFERSARAGRHAAPVPRGFPRPHAACSTRSTGGPAGMPVSPGRCPASASSRRCATTMKAIPTKFPANMPPGIRASGVTARAPASIIWL